ncbi:hypothetical protein [Bacillus sp. P14.5]|uniref:hypothetical protein n=1 Tax=Bacillus sp. P14.5 TaxID=1983400 RepID=UPI000DEAFD9F|nr:hypothetical protein [Bacillus sp. P14.5]
MNGVFHFSEGAFDTVLDETLYFSCSYDIVGNVRFGIAGFAQFAHFVYALGSENGCGDVGSCIRKIPGSASDISVDDIFFKGLLEVFPNVWVLISLNTFFSDDILIKIKHLMPKRRLSSV